MANGLSRLFLAGLLLAPHFVGAAPSCEHVFTSDHRSLSREDDHRINDLYGDVLRDLPAAERVEALWLIDQLERRGFTSGRIRWEIDRAKTQDRCE